MKLTTIEGGLLAQEQDHFTLENAKISIPTKRQPTEQEWESLKLAGRLSNM